MQALKEIFGKNHIVLSMLVIGLLGVLVYSNTFKAPFQWDESIYLQANPFVRGELGLFDADKIHDSVAAEGPDRVIGEELYRNLITRYVAYLSFALNYRIHRFDVRGYHIVNLAIHVINALLVYLLVRLFFATPALSLSSLRDIDHFHHDTKAVTLSKMSSQGRSFSVAHLLPPDPLASCLSDEPSP